MSTPTNNHNQSQSIPGRLYAEPTPSADPKSFQVNNTSSAYYKSPYYLAHMTQLQPMPPPRISPPRLDLADVIGPDAIGRIQQAQKIVFHSAGDTGAAKVDHAQTVASALANEESVADTMAADVQAGGPGAPSFFFHLGDVIYSFGEAQYYHDQFYEPYREYDRPIFAIPGNHDGMVFGATSATPQVPTLEAFLRNFCAAAPGTSPDSGGLVRSVMTQPGVYFTLDAPFVSIIGLYSNVLDGPGVISSQGGHYPIGDDQLTFLKTELTRLKADHDAGNRAVLVAVHHPPASVDSKHGGSTGLAADIDNCCIAAGVWPDAVLSGHAHLYQRFSRAAKGLKRQIPYVTSGSGGYAATSPKTEAAAGTTDGTYTLVTPPVIEFGYLTIIVDMNGPQKTLTIGFKSVKGTKDSVTVALTPVAGVGGTPAPAPASGAAGAPAAAGAPPPSGKGPNPTPAGKSPASRAAKSRH